MSDLKLLTPWVNILAKSYNFPPKTKIYQFLPCFYLPTSAKIFTASIKWRKAPEIFSLMSMKLCKKS